ncbi:hypothetical protein [Nocardiopsis sp. CNR-923]|uniref:hypothetical protein n=1 Tax=Nocardiopsis sp. CNR-923 TaxID=1904965 RepID=UPI0029165D5B|nr:hypothetical protein [Nocardiopsis sp. CNR-923]
MPQQASTALRSAAASADAAPTAPRPARVSLEGIGDVLDAGRSSGYAHLGEHRLPTIGRLVSAARAPPGRCAAPRSGRRAGAAGSSRPGRPAATRAVGSV